MSICYLGDLRREFHHVKQYRAGELDPEYEPTMVLFLEGRLGKSAMIPLSSAYKYDEPDGTEAKEAALTQCIGIARHLGIDTGPRSLAQLAMFIQDGLDELVSMPPYREATRTVGEMELSIGGKRTSKDVSLTESELFV